MPRRAVRRPHLLVGALAVLLMIPSTTWHQVAVAAPAPAVPTATEVTGPASAEVGIETQLTAEVSPAGAEGTVEFTVDEVPVGTSLNIDGGLATFSHTFTSAGVFTVRATFIPTDASEYETSEDLVGLDVTVSGGRSEPWPTATVVGAPSQARAGTPVTLFAGVSPSGAAGTVRFSVDGAPVGAPVPVSGGSASMSHDFTTGGPHAVSATFTPADPVAFAGSSATPVTVAVLQATVTTVTGPDAALPDAPAMLTATVSPAGAAGTVSFSVDGVPVGSPVPVESGTASLSHTFASEGTATVRATFVPTDPASYEESSDTAGLTVTIGKVKTSVTITGPKRVTAGAWAEFAAMVTPAGVPGAVTFRFAGRTNVTVPVESGTAVASHRFASIRRSPVVATWKPTDGDRYLTATDELETDVVPGTTAEEFSTYMTVATPTMTFFQGCPKAGTRDNPVVLDFLFRMTSLMYDILQLIYDTFSVVLSAVLCGPGRGQAKAAEPVEQTITCALTDDGLDCPFRLPAFSELTIAGAVPVPAELAGQDVAIDSSVSRVDPETGVLTPVSSQDGAISVPRRTVLGARLTPVKQHLTSIGPGRLVAYRLKVDNNGVVAATDVRVCARVGRGAGIRSAPHAEVRNRRACWTIPRLGAGRSATRTVTLVAPRHGKELTVAAVLRARGGQADPVRLSAEMPVR